MAAATNPASTDGADSSPMDLADAELVAGVDGVDARDQKDVMVAILAVVDLDEAVLGRSTPLLPAGSSGHFGWTDAGV